MLDLIIAFIVMLNPFALFSYLEPIRKDLTRKEYTSVLFKASLISLVIYSAFILFGNFLFDKIFQIHFEAFRIFGGIVIFAFAYQYIVGGRKGILKLKTSLDDLASDIALPFMVGAGTISIVLLMTRDLSIASSFIGVFLALTINFSIIFGLSKIREFIPKKKFKIAFDKNMSIFTRIIGFFSGAIGINMILTGILNLFF